MLVGSGGLKWVFVGRLFFGWSLMCSCVVCAIYIYIYIYIYGSLSVCVCVCFVRFGVVYFIYVPCVAYAVCVCYSCVLCVCYCKMWHFYVVFFGKRYIFSILSSDIYGFLYGNCEIKQTVFSPKNNF